LIDVKTDGTDFLPEKLTARIQKKAPKLRRENGILLRFPRVIAHLDFLVD
jgi:hypothetical protein